MPFPSKSMSSYRLVAPFDLRTCSYICVRMHVICSGRCVRNWALTHRTKRLFPWCKLSVCLFVYPIATLIYDTEGHHNHTIPTWISSTVFLNLFSCTFVHPSGYMHTYTHHITSPMSHTFTLYSACSNCIVSCVLTHHYLSPVYTSCSTLSHHLMYCTFHSLCQSACL